MNNSELSSPADGTPEQPPPSSASQMTSVVSPPLGESTGNPTVTDAVPINAMEPFTLQQPADEAAVSAGNRGRGISPGSGLRQRSGDSGSLAAGSEIQPHVIKINAGEDVLAKVMAFSQSISKAVCVMSASGFISTVSLHQAATSGATVTYEGRFEILNMSGYFFPLESGGRSREGGLTVAFVGPDGSVCGGRVAGLLRAASAVQVTVGSFSIEEQRPPRSGNSDTFGTPASFVSGASAGRSPQSLGTFGESSARLVRPRNQTTNSIPSGVDDLNFPPR